MKKIILGNNQMKASEICVGLWRIHETTVAEVEKLIKTALDLGIDFFDHANIYGRGECEKMFAQAIGMNSSVREKFYLQSKCGIVVDRPEGVYFDFSREQILTSVDASLKRLKTDYLDVLLLHRPDALFEPEEVADAFNVLATSGKVRHFGVSNQRPGQIKLLRKYVPYHFMVNQMQFSLTNSSMVDCGLCTNMEFAQCTDRDGDILDYCRLNDITIQAWSPFQYGIFEGTFLGNKEKFPELNNKLEELAKAKGVSISAIAAAWILRHPAHIQVIAGTTKAERVKEIAKASGIEITRPEWYDLWRAAGNMLP